eukprot:295732-Rhodomonas_salina.1
MRVCALVKIIKDWASGTGPHAAVWKEGNNMLIASRNMVTAGTLLTLTLVEAAITLAQLHTPFPCLMLGEEQLGA